MSISLVSPHRRLRQRAQARVFLLLGAVVLALLALAAIWLLRSHRNSVPAQIASANEPQEPVQSRLSEATLAVLRGLKAPVEIRLYSSLTPGGQPARLAAFAARVEDLLGQYEQAANQKLRVLRRNPGADSDAQAAAAADGVTPWTLDGGGVCYLGLAVAQGGRIEPMQQLLPEWEDALESDVTRAILRVTQAPPPAATRQSPEAAAAALRAVEEKIPNLASVSLEEGTRILREVTVQEFIAAVKETQPQIDALEQRMREVEGSLSDADRQRLLDQLSTLQARQQERIEQITGELETQIAALEQLKGVPTPPATPAQTQQPTRRTR